MTTKMASPQGGVELPKAAPNLDSSSSNLVGTSDEASVFKENQPDGEMMSSFTLPEDKPLAEDKFASSNLSPDLKEFFNAKIELVRTAELTDSQKVVLNQIFDEVIRYLEDNPDMYGLEIGEEKQRVDSLIECAMLTPKEVGEESYALLAPENLRVMSLKQIDALSLLDKPDAERKLKKMESKGIDTATQLSGANPKASRVIKGAPSYMRSIEDSALGQEASLSNVASALEGKLASPELSPDLKEFFQDKIKVVSEAESSILTESQKIVLCQIFDEEIRYLAANPEMFPLEKKEQMQYVDSLVNCAIMKPDEIRELDYSLLDPSYVRVMNPGQIYSFQAGSWYTVRKVLEQLEEKQIETAAKFSSEKDQWEKRKGEVI